MTAPVVVPTKWKAVAALVGGILGALAPIIAQLAGVLPAPWGAILTGIGGVIALVTGKVVYETPYAPPNTTLVPTGTTPIAHPPASPPDVPRYDNPFRPKR